MFRDLLRRLGCRVKDERGFTLIELLVVVVIIGVLVTIALPRFLGQSEKAREKVALSDLRAMKSVMEVYIADEGNGVSPSTAGRAKDILQDGGIKDKKSPWNTSYHYYTGSITDGQYAVACQDAKGAYYSVSDQSEPKKANPPSGYNDQGSLW